MDSGRFQRERHHQYPCPVTQAGATLLFIIAVLILLSFLATAISLLAPAATLTNLANNRDARARYLALSGLGFWSAGTTGTYAIGDGSFTLTQSGPDASGYYTVTSRGTVLGGTGLEANVLLTARRSALSPLTFTADLSDFAAPVVGKTENSASAITVYAANVAASGPGNGTGNGYGNGNGIKGAAGKAYASGWVRLGGAVKDTNGAIWYAGSRGSCPGGVCPDGMCQAGKCAFAKGLRAYFGFAFTLVDNDKRSESYGDGFTFTVINATGNNLATAAGGPASGSLGEYLGYAGPGPSGCGIAAPKMAVEVDVYPNRGDEPPDTVNSRRDSSVANHIAAVFWGDAGLYDDNVHGAGSLPVNPSGPSFTNVGYYEQTKQDGQPNWLEDGKEHALRLEIHRADAPTGGTYLIEVWIDGSGDAFADVSKDYADETPQIAYATTLATVDHDKLDTVSFGWTEGTGKASQDVAIHDFSLEFRR